METNLSGAPSVGIARAREVKAAKSAANSVKGSQGGKASGAARRSASAINSTKGSTETEPSLPMSGPGTINSSSTDSISAASGFAPSGVSTASSLGIPPSAFLNYKHPHRMEPASTSPLLNLYGNATTAYAKLSEADKADDDKVLASLSSGVTPATISANLAAWKASTDVCAGLVSCATCGVRRLPEIVHSVLPKRVKRVNQSAITYVPLSDLAVRHPWVLLERGKCEACFAAAAAAPTPAARAALPSCPHVFEQRKAVAVARPQRPGTGRSWQRQRGRASWGQRLARCACRCRKWARRS